MSSGYLKNLKKLRQQKGWSQEKLAHEAGISYQTLIKIERGYIKNPKLETLIKIAKALKVSLEDLIKT
ncbi:MAG: helix-turn-helix domain-containing protein [Candidatus Omnitrophica bacterium]|nr:helix-turn-helix domain-containing protein [Candidatus Omnitrophota bacterium]